MKIRIIFNQDIRRYKGQIKTWFGWKSLDLTGSIMHSEGREALCQTKDDAQGRIDNYCSGKAKPNGKWHVIYSAEDQVLPHGVVHGN